MRFLLTGIFRQKKESIAIKKKWGQKKLSYQEYFQARLGVAKECISQYKVKKEGVFRVIEVA